MFFSSPSAQRFQQLCGTGRCAGLPPCRETERFRAWPHDSAHCMRRPCWTDVSYASLGCLHPLWSHAADACPARRAGFFFGRTPLIKLSPKKTWEGFLGGLVLTVLCSWLLADLMSRWSWMTCPRTVRAPCHSPCASFLAAPMPECCAPGCWRVPLELPAHGARTLSNHACCAPGCWQGLCQGGPGWAARARLHPSHRYSHTLCRPVRKEPDGDQTVQRVEERATPTESVCALPSDTVYTV